MTLLLGASVLFFSLGCEPRLPTSKVAGEALSDVWLIPEGAPELRFAADVPVRRPIDPGETQSFSLQGAPGQLFELEIRKEGAVLTITVDGEAGELGVDSWSLQFPSGPRGTDLLIVRTPPSRVSSGEARARTRISVRPPPDGRLGFCEISIRQLSTDDAFERRSAQDVYARAWAQEAAQPPELEEAEAGYREAAAQWERAGEERLSSYALSRLGELLLARDRAAEAAEVLEAAADQQEELADPAAAARTRWTLGRAQRNAGDTESAARTFEDALQLAARSGDLHLEALLVNSLGLALDQLGDKRQAIAHFERAEQLFRKQGRPSEATTALANLAATLDELGDSERAIPVLERTVEQHRAAGNELYAAIALHNLGTALDKVGRKQESLRAYHEVLGIFDELGNHEGRTYVRINLGRLYSSLGEERIALRYYAEALEVLDERPDPRLEGWIRSNRGSVYHELGELQEARRELERALDLRRQTDDRRGEAFTLHNLGDVALGLARQEEAIALFRQALDLWDEIEEPRGALGTWSALGRALQAAGDVEGARRALHSALDVAGRVWDPDGEAEALYRLARFLQETGAPEQALERSREAVDIVESLRYELASPDLRRSLLNTKWHYYELLISLLMERADSSGIDDDSRAAFEVLERARARGLRELLREASLETRHPAVAELLAEEGQIEAELGELFRKVGVGAVDDATNDDLRRIDLLQERYRYVQDEIRASHPDYASLVRVDPITVEEVQRLLREGEVLLEFLLGEDRSYAWAIGSRSFTAIDLPPRQHIEAAVKRWLELLRNSRELEARLALDGAAKAVREALVDPCLQALDSQRLLFVPDGILHYVPFAALPVPGNSGDVPLVEKTEVVVLPAASLLARWSRQNEGSRGDAKPIEGPVAIFADPVYSADDERLRGLEASLVEPESSSSSQDGRHTAMPRLPYTAREAEAIAELMPRPPTAVFTGFDAERGRVTSERLSDFEVIHFATHGVFDADRPERSGLLLSRYDATGRSVDGFLRPRDLYELDLEARLVVLSGCETALGDLDHGEGLVGLTRGWIVAGADSVVATLWPVDDRATATLVASFYEGLIKGGVPPAAALRRAQLRVASDPTTKAPYYWAAFLYQGR